MQNFKASFSSLYCAFCCSFYRRHKRKIKKKKWDVPNNKLFQIHSRVFTKGRIACKLNAIFYSKSTIVYCFALI